MDKLLVIFLALHYFLLVTFGIGYSLIPILSFPLISSVFVLLPNFLLFSVTFMHLSAQLFDVCP